MEKLSDEENGEEADFRSPSTKHSRCHLIVIVILSVLLALP